MMIVLITGNHGYIGSVLAQLLKSRGHRVVGLDSGFFIESTLWEYPVPDITIYKDIRNVDINDIKGIDAIVHLAALSNDPLGELNSQLTYEINYKASVRLASLAKKFGIERFVFSSSCSVYGDSAENEVSEKSKTNPLTAYADSKVRTEKDLLAMCGDGFMPIIFRNATVYGASPMFRSDLVVNNLTCSAITSNKVKLQSTGNAWRPMVNVVDVCEAMSWAIETPRDLTGEIFNIGYNEHNYKIIDLARMVCNVTNAELEIAEGAMPDKRSYRVNFDKIVETFPEFRNSMTPIEEGIQEVYEDLLEANLTHESFVNGKYARLNELKRLLNEGQISENLYWTTDI